MTQSSLSSLPKHIAIIMDGNGRWAQARKLDRIEGHKEGIKAALRLIKLCQQKTIKVLTLFAFSTENWKRPKKEVNGILDLLQLVLKEKIPLLLELNLKLKIIGDLKRLGTTLQKSIRYAESMTQNCTNMTLVIALNYGGQWDITQAAKKIAIKIAKGILQPDEVTVETFGRHLDLSDLPIPDLCIRTGGESRISNFLLWHLAYSELYFTKTLWPDFDSIQFEQALTAYIHCDRRFGNIYEEQSA